ncbi:hypothetical protein H2248_002220 [Termitomyces sp. 'cryptogamus']|nr:hypothetical protein H2248_002220 [Termitomyces sp. 'cryptogamus']
MPTPTSANSDTSPANSDGPLANFGACPAATDTYPGLPKPREPPPLFLIFAHPSLTQHPASSDLFRNITTTSEQPAIPSTYQRGTIFDHNRHPPTPSSPAKPCRHSRRTPKSSGISRSYLSLPVLSRPLFVIILVIVSYLHSNLLLFHIVSSDAVSVMSSDPCAQFFINPNDLTNSAIIITNPDTPYQVRTSLFALSRTPSTPNDLPSNPGSAPIDHTATYSLASANLPYGLLPEPRQDRLISPQSDFSGPSRTCLDHISQLPAQTTRTQNVFECPVTNAGESRPPSKDSPSAAAPPRSVDPDRAVWIQEHQLLLDGASTTFASIQDGLVQVVGGSTQQVGQGVVRMGQLLVGH